MLLPAPLSRYVGSIRSLKQKWRRHTESEQQNRSENSVARRMIDVFLRTWDLGFTAFGGPPVHFQILHGRFVEGKGGKEKWVDEQTYQELFAICQGLPGPGSTKMLFCLTLLHAGVFPAIMAFLLWSLPGAIGMYCLSIGIQNVSQSLPGPVYALLSGLNAATVGIVAVSAVQLSEKAIQDNISRILVIWGACAGLCYNALWFFPVLMLIGGFVIAIWDGWLYSQIQGMRIAWKNRHGRPAGSEEANTNSMVIESIPPPGQEVERNEPIIRSRRVNHNGTPPQCSGALLNPIQSTGTGVSRSSPKYGIRIRTGLAILTIFFASFIAILVARAKLAPPPLPLDLFASMYLAGTVIFGGGPVVIPLLRSYVVGPGWVSSRDFLIGLAIIQAFPGPNFNFAVFLGSLALQHSQFPTVFGAFLGWLGIFVPGITLAVAVQSFWSVLRKRRSVTRFLRGVNATAIGLVFTAVYRLWQIGYLTPANNAGQSLANEPWWLVVTTVSYAGNAWFRLPPAVSIIIGAILGLCWYGAVGR
ncbi:chromate transporter-domain-containing protein [Talaromyces proteolyticus]|uniref:Chromate transporter-domain-containing protein n=1 Tax=Talaromyces proteolyticus TaxID=1131652 RepID=A0AAD4KYM1_9EURO|nr:chromate transporter-domain-containing protein [Talaromyces proteolyticus]KAH8703945.1 chromate transporter-domain-containing protein [Talaromyces proteolyticus]